MNRLTLQERFRFQLEIVIVSVLGHTGVRREDVRDGTSLAAAVPLGALPVRFTAVRVVLDVAMTLVDEYIVSSSRGVRQLRSNSPNLGHYKWFDFLPGGLFRFQRFGCLFLHNFFLRNHIRSDKFSNVENFIFNSLI